MEQNPYIMGRNPGLAGVEQDLDLFCFSLVGRQLSVTKRYTDSVETL